MVNCKHRFYIDEYQPRLHRVACLDCKYTAPLHLAPGTKIKAA